MSLIITRANPTNWVAGNLLTATQINTVDQNPVTVAEYVEGQRTDVKLYGALGDNATDDSAAIQAAQDAAVASQTPLWFPPGIYLCNGIVWGNCSLIGVPHESRLRCNSTSAPLFVTSTDYGVDDSTRTAKKVSGLRCSFFSTSTTGELFSVGGDARILFDTCELDSSGSSGFGTGAVGLGSASDTTWGIFRNCNFVLSGASDLLVAKNDGTTYAVLSDCRVQVTSAARTESFSLINTDSIRVANCQFNLSAATAAATYVKVFGGSSTDELVVSGTSVTEAASGTVSVFNQGAAGVVSDAANVFPEDARLFVSEPVRWNAASRRRPIAVEQTGGGNLSIDAMNYDVFMVNIDDTTAFAVTSTGAPVGTEFDIIMWSSSGSPTGTITWNTSYFFNIATATHGYGMPAVILPGTVASARFRRAIGPSGAERWFLIGSGVVYP